VRFINNVGVHKDPQFHAAPSLSNLIKRFIYQKATYDWLIGLQLDFPFDRLLNHYYFFAGA